MLARITLRDVVLVSEVESRTQGSRPRTQKKSEAKVKDSLSEDRHSRGQGQECSRPRTQAQVLSKKKKRSSQKFQKIFRALHKILTIQKIVLSSSRLWRQMHFYFKILRLSVLCLYDSMHCNWYRKRYYGPCVNILSLQNFPLIIIT